jgi:hypothetical protein
MVDVKKLLNEQNFYLFPILTGNLDGDARWHLHADGYPVLDHIQDRLEQRGTYNGPRNGDPIFLG